MAIYFIGAYTVFGGIAMLMFRSKPDDSDNPLLTDWPVWASVAIFSIILAVRVIYSCLKGDSEQVENEEDQFQRA